MYPPTYLPTVRSHGLLQASSLESPQPFHRPPSHHLTPCPPRDLLVRSVPLLADLSPRLATRNFRFFRGQPSQPPPTPVFPLFADRYIACRPVRRYHTVHPRRAHIFPTPRRVSHWERQQRDRPRGFLQDEERERGEGGREGWPYILLSFFERFQAHRSSTTARPVLVTRRCDAPTRSLSPCSFFPE